MMVLRVHGDDLMFGGSGGVITHSPRIPQMEMMKVHIPFTFKLHESFKSTYAGKYATARLYARPKLRACWPPRYFSRLRICVRFDRARQTLLKTLS